MDDSWYQIADSGGPDRVNLRRVDAAHPIDLYRGKDHLGNYVFSFHGEVSDPESLELPDLGRIELILRPLGREGPHRWELTARLLDPEHKDIFRALCADLIAATQVLGEGEHQAAFRVIVRRLQRWQALLRENSRRELSFQARLGLFGELLVLRDRLLPRLESAAAVQAWRGAEGDEQDFLLPAGVVEVKTQLASTDKSIKVASEHQLFDSALPVWLCHQTIAVGSDATEGASSLGSIVEEIRGMLHYESSWSRDLFDARLLECGYSRSRDALDDAWMLAERSWYHVTGDFPRVTPMDLRSGVECVRYGIRPEACKPYEVREEIALSGILECDE